MAVDWIKSQIVGAVVPDALEQFLDEVSNGVNQLQRIPKDVSSTYNNALATISDIPWGQTQDGLLDLGDNPFAQVGGLQLGDLSSVTDDLSFSFFAQQLLGHSFGISNSDGWWSLTASEGRPQSPRTCAALCYQFDFSFNETDVSQWRAGVTLALHGNTIAYEKFNDGSGRKPRITISTDFQTAIGIGEKSWPADVFIEGAIDGVALSKLHEIDQVDTVLAISPKLTNLAEITVSMAGPILIADWNNLEAWRYDLEALKLELGTPENQISDSSNNGEFEAVVSVTGHYDSAAAKAKYPQENWKSRFGHPDNWYFIVAGNLSFGNGGYQARLDVVLDPQTGEKAIGVTLGSGGFTIKKSFEDEMSRQEQLEELGYSPKQVEILLQMESGDGLQGEYAEQFSQMLREEHARARMRLAPAPLSPEQAHTVREQAYQTSVDRLLFSYGLRFRATGQPLGFGLNDPSQGFLDIDVHITSNKDDVDYGALDLPTMIVWGKEDGITPPSVARQFQGRISGSQLMFIDK